MKQTKIEVFDFTKFPSFNRHSVGFEDLFRRLSAVDMWANSVNSGANNYPPYDIESTDENQYLVTLAVSGFGKKDIKITVKNNRLEIIGHKERKPARDERDDESRFLHKGIATRNFQLYFSLEDHVEVKSAKFADGLLAIKLERVIPEALRERVIEIK